MSGAKTAGSVCGHPNDRLAEEPTMTTENADLKIKRMRELSQELDRLSQAQQKAVSEWMELAKDISDDEIEWLRQTSPAAYKILRGQK
jgi:hypothetical protein